MSHLSRTVMALAETSPPLAGAVRAAGCGPSGLALPGLLGWLPFVQLFQVTRACWLAGWDLSIRYPYESAYDMAEVLHDLALWRHPRGETEESRIHEAALTWSTLSGRVPLLDLVAVKAGEVLT